MTLDTHVSATFNATAPRDEAMPDKLYRIDNLTREAFQRLYNIDIDTAARELVASIDGQARVVITARGRGSQVDYIDFDVSSYAFSFNRRLVPANHSVTHISATVDDKGHGFASRVNQAFFELYRQLDIATIDTMASDIGAYAWARSGFYPDDRAWLKLRTLLADRLSYLVDHPPPEGALPESTVATLQAALNGVSGKNYWAIVDAATPCHNTTLGKALTLDVEGMPPKLPTTWVGIFDLKDEECVQRKRASEHRAQVRANAPGLK